MTALLLLVIVVSPALAAPNDDQYAVASAHYRRARWELAADEFTVFLERYPDDPRTDSVRFFLAESLVQLGRYPQAGRQFEQLLQRSPRHQFARQARFRLGETAYLSEQDVEARRQLTLFRDAYPTDELNAYVLPYLGDILLRAGEPRGAEAEYAEALRQFPQGPLADECRFGIGKAYQQLGDAASAERFYRFLTLNDQGPLAAEALFQMATLQHQQREYDKTRQTLTRFLERFPDSPLRSQAYYWLGKTQVVQGQLTEAAATYELALAASDDPHLSAALCFDRAECLRQVGDVETARGLYEQVQRQWPDSLWAAEALQARVTLAFQSDDDEAVETLAEQFGQLHPGHRLTPRVRLLQGRSLLKHQQFDQAAHVFRTLLASAPAGSPNSQQDPAEQTAPEQTAAEQTAAEQTAPEPTAADGSEPEPAGLSAPGTGRAKLSDESAEKYWLPTAEYYLVLAELGAGRFEDSLAILKQVRSTGGQDGRGEDLREGFLEAEAAALIGLARFADAIEPLRAYLRIRPEGGNAIKCRAQLTVALTHEKRFAEADPLFDRLRDECTDQDLLLKTTLYVADANSQAGRDARARVLYGLLAANENPPEYIAKGLSGLAWSAARTNDLKASEEAFGRLAERFPGHADAAEAALMRAASLEKLNKAEEAIEAYRVVWQSFPDSPQAPHALLAAAQQLESLKKLDDAEALLRQAATTYPQYERGDVVLYLHAWLLEDLGRGEQADAVFARLAEQWPRSGYWADATYRLAERAARGADYERAVLLTNRLLDSPTAGVVRCHALYLRGQLAATSGQWDQVDEPMGSLVREFPESDLRLPAEYWRAEAAYRAGDYELAGQRFGQLARQTEGRSDAWLGMVPLRRAQVLAQQKNWREAESLVAPIAEQFPGFRQQYEVDYLLGRCLSSRARFDDAREAFQRVVRSPAGGRTETAAMAQWMIGETYFLQKRYEDAVKAYYRVETLFEFPRWQAAALLQAGKCREMQGNWNEAVKLYAQLLKDYPDTRFHDESSRRLRQAKLRTSSADTR